MNTRTAQIASIAFAAAMAHAGTVLYTQDFESDPGTSYSITTQYENAGLQTHFLHNDTTHAQLSTYSNTDGKFVSGKNDNFFGYTDTVTTGDIDITGQSTLNFAVDLARHSEGTFWDSTSHVDFQYAIGGSAIWTSFYTVDTDGVSNGTPLFDGVAITSSFASFNTQISGLSGLTMQIRIVWANMGLGDSLAIDNIAVSTVPLPPAAFAGLGLLGCLGIVRIANRLHP